MVIAANHEFKHSPVMDTNAKSRIPKEMLPASIGERLALIRNAFGLKPSEMAEILDIERTYWSRFEKGHRVVSNEVAYLLCERFGVTLDFVLLGRWDKLPMDVSIKLREAESSSDQ